MLEAVVAVSSLLVVVGVLMAAHVLGSFIDRMQKANAKFLTDALTTLTNERHWQAQNSVEARMVDTLTGAVNVQSETVKDLSDKMLAFTSEGRDHMRNMHEIQAMRQQLEELRFLNAGLVAKHTGAEPEPARMPVRDEPGRTVATFGEGPG